MKKFVIRTDMEGTSGIVSPQQAEVTGSEYAVGLEYFTNDLNAAIDGLIDGGAERIILYDEHFYGRNTQMHRLHGGDKVCAINGKPPYRADWAGGLDGTCDGLIMLGFHAKAGTVGALLQHSYESEIADITVNGLSVGELGIETLIAAEYGVPLVMVTGDDMGVAEALALTPGAIGVVVKRGCGESGGIVYPIEITNRMIYEAAHKLAQSPKPLAMDRLSDPVEFKITLKPSRYLTAVKLQNRGRVQGETLILTQPTLLACWAEYWRIKLEAQALAAAKGDGA